MKQREAVRGCGVELKRRLINHSLVNSPSVQLAPSSSLKRYKITGSKHVTAEEEFQQRPETRDGSRTQKFLSGFFAATHGATSETHQALRRLPFCTVENVFIKA
ncbi:uncharacterized protein V6R79_001813 [Siganus canaliculatus]